MTAPIQSTSAPKIIKAHCPRCGAGTNACVRAEHTVAAADPDDGTSSSDTGRILECCGCERVYFQRNFWFSEWETVGQHPITGDPCLEGGIETTYWPAPITRAEPKWIAEIHAADRTLDQLLSEMYTALNSDLRVLAAIAARTTFDRSSELLGIDPALSFKRKLSALVDRGKISTDESEILAALIDAGGAAAHRGWRPAPDDLNTMIDVVEAFLHRSFILGDGIKKLKAAVPPYSSKP